MTFEYERFIDGVEIALECSKELISAASQHLHECDIYDLCVESCYSSFISSSVLTLTAVACLGRQSVGFCFAIPIPLAPRASNAVPPTPRPCAVAPARARAAGARGRARSRWRLPTRPTHVRRARPLAATSRPVVAHKHLALAVRDATFLAAAGLVLGGGRRRGQKQGGEEGERSTHVYISSWRTCLVTWCLR